MADFIFIRKSRNILSSILHILFNIFLAIISIFVTIITGSWILGILLVLLSKWRVFAVRPRYWLVNLKSNLVDLIVGAGVVFIPYCAGTTIYPIHYILTVFYIVWLIGIKPLSSTFATELQALLAIFIGTTAAVLMTASAHSIFLCLSCFVIGYGAARHVIVQSDDRDFSLITLTCGLVAAELAWLCHSWLIVYRFGITGIIVPQLSVILIILAFAFSTAYKSILKHDGKFKSSEVAMPLFFSLLTVIIIIIWFSQPIFNV